MKVKVVSRKLVKPSKATPPHLGCYKLSLLEQVNPAVNHTRILYYSCDDGKSECVLLEESMAQILSNFYPLAGRFNKEKQQVDCNDQGALFSTAQVDVDLSLILRSHVDPHQLNHLLPVDLDAVDGPTDPIVTVQINMFQRGGLAIAVCASHRLIEIHRDQYSGKNTWLPKYAFGTWITGSALELAAEKTAAHAQGENFSALASRIRHATVHGVRDCARVLEDKEFGRKLLVGNFLDGDKKADTGNYKVIWLTDLSKIGDYELDFGFGKPDWVSLATPAMVKETEDYIILLNNRSNDGIEAWVCLHESDMHFFRQDKEILLLSASTLSVFSRI